MTNIECLKTRIPELDIIKTFPASGQKQVYLVYIPQYGKIILKFIKEMDERISREIDIVSQNNITDVPKIILLDSFENDNETVFYIIEEYVEGENLKEILKRGSIDVPSSLHLLESLLKILVELEKIKIIHRDIKPENIIYGVDGKYHLIDFGIARNLNLSSLTFTQMVVGPHTPGYGAPELFQYSKANINIKADLFSVGVVVYECIFGKHPFITGQEFDLNEIWYKTATVSPKENFIPGDDDKQLIGFLQTLMQKHISKRPPTAQKALEWFYIVKNSLNI